MLLDRQEPQLGCRRHSPCKRSTWEAKPCVSKDAPSPAASTLSWTVKWCLKSFRDVFPFCSTFLSVLLPLSHSLSEKCTHHYHCPANMLALALCAVTFEPLKARVKQACCLSAGNPLCISQEKESVPDPFLRDQAFPRAVSVAAFS